MKKELKYFYFPQTIAYPVLARRWKKIRSYRQREREIHGDLVDVIRYDLPAPTPGAAGKKICFVSDFHYMGTDTDIRCSQECSKLLRRIAPDLLLLGGDLCGDAVALPKLSDLLNELSNIAPTAAIPGNWERRKAWLKTPYWHELYKKYNIVFLSNDSLEDDIFFIYGADDLRYGRPAIPPAFPADKTVLLLAHEPDSAVDFDNKKFLAGVDLILSGHTHGGQIRFPLLGPLLLPSLYGTRFDYGLFRHKSAETQLIVSSGMGHLSFPRRFNCKREIVQILFN